MIVADLGLLFLKTQPPAKTGISMTPATLYMVPVFFAIFTNALPHRVLKHSHATPDHLISPLVCASHLPECPTLLLPLLLLLCGRLTCLLLLLPPCCCLLLRCLLLAAAAPSTLPWPVAPSHPAAAAAAAAGKS
jgi:hypothetical protein